MGRARSGRFIRSNIVHRYDSNSNSDIPRSDALCSRIISFLYTQAEIFSALGAHHIISTAGKAFLGKIRC